MPRKVSRIRERIRSRSLFFCICKKMTLDLENGITSNKDCDCSICLEEMTNFKTIDCGHHFHKECIDRWIRENENPECPICRAQIKVHIPLYVNLKFKCISCMKQTTFFAFYILTLNNVYMATSLNDNFGLFWIFTTMCSASHPKSLYMSGMMGIMYSSFEVGNIVYDDIYISESTSSYFVYYLCLSLQALIIVIVSLQWGTLVS